MNVEALLHQLQEAKEATASCPLCWLETRQVSRYLQGVANDGVNNVPLRLKLAERGGYCAAHSRDFAELASPLSAAILLESFLQLRLKRAAQGKRPLQLRCEACEVAAKTRETLRRNLKRHQNLSSIQDFLLNVPLCLTHTELLGSVMPASTRARMLARQDKLLADLAELIRKFDYRFVHESRTPDEVQSIQRALDILADEASA